MKTVFILMAIYMTPNGVDSTAVKSYPTLEMCNTIAAELNKEWSASTDVRFDCAEIKVRK